MVDAQQLEAAIWSIADGLGSDDDLGIIDADAGASLAVLDRLIIETEDHLAGVRGLPGDERDQVVADFMQTLTSLRVTAARFRPASVASPSRSRDWEDIEAAPAEILEPEEVQLQASWSAGQVIVWAGGRGALPEADGALIGRLASMDGPPAGWKDHPPVSLPGGERAEALAISMKDALGWLVALGVGTVAPVRAPASSGSATSRSKAFGSWPEGRSCRA